jgi:hypothetical protein
MEEAVHFYEHVPDAASEAPRLSVGWGQLELARTRELIERHLPAPPKTVLDIGGAASAPLGGRPHRRRDRPLRVAAGFPGARLHRRPALRAHPRRRPQERPAPQHNRRADYFTTAFFHLPEELSVEHEPGPDRRQPAPSGGRPESVNERRYSISAAGLSVMMPSTPARTRRFQSLGRLEVQGTT